MREIIKMLAHASIIIMINRIKSNHVLLLALLKIIVYYASAVFVLANFHSVTTIVFGFSKV
jgi:hypothetical protein